MKYIRSNNADKPKAAFKATRGSSAPQQFYKLITRMSSYTDTVIHAKVLHADIYFSIN